MVKKFCTFLARPSVFFWATGWLIVMLILGTLAQKEIGLYQAQDTYFKGWIVFLGDVVPVPGTMLVLTLITVSLALRVFMDSWIWPKAGTIITHFAVLVLLIGGFVTATFSEEGAVILPLGEPSSAVQDYYSLELVINGGDAITFSDKDLHDGALLLAEGLPFSVNVLTRAAHATPVMDGEKVDLKTLPRLPVEEENLSAVRLQIKDQTLALFEGIPMNKDLTVDGKDYTIFLRHEQRPLPFSMTLNKFKKDVYPGTENAKSYSSNITIQEGDLQWDAFITMNEPLRYKGYTFYQSSFIQTDKQIISVLAAVKNSGRIFPYLAGALLAIGLLIHAFQRIPKLLTLTLALISLSPVAQAQDRLDMDAFSRLPILHEGRLQPIDSFARHHLEVFSGKERIANLQAVDWLAAVIFAPDIAKNLKIFKLHNPDIAHAIDLPWNGTTELYSFENIRQAMRGHTDMLQSIEASAPETLTPAQTQLMDLQRKLMMYLDLSHSLSVRTPGNIKQFPAMLFKTIPPQWNITNGEWRSPWEITASGQGAPGAVALFEKWGAVSVAYRSLNTDAWAIASADLLQTMTPHMNVGKIKAEKAYNSLSLYPISMGLYIAAGLILLTTLIGWTNAPLLAGRSLLSMGLLVHITAIALRIYIMGRPPVSTLYESILFVGAISVLFALLYDLKTKNGLGVLIGAISGTLLHLVGFSYASSGSTIQVLVPVLNTNFWLATHVVTITIGYGACLVTGLIAHADLVQRARGLTGNTLLKGALAMGLIALLFSVIGTLLGGIWADQSWGRFWGWDPKENGAMLICLWLILMLHGRISGTLKTIPFIAGMAFLPAIVSMAWFGVNLLNVGLHSYGFTDGVARYLFSFVGLEIVFITGALYSIYRKERV